MRILFYDRSSHHTELTCVRISTLSYDPEKSLMSFFWGDLYVCPMSAHIAERILKRALSDGHVDLTDYHFVMNARF